MELIANIFLQRYKEATVKKFLADVGGKTD